MPIDKKVALLTVVSMPSRAYTSFLHGFNRKGSDSVVPVSMPSRAYTSFLHVGDDGFKYLELDPSVNALSGLYLISTKTTDPITDKIIAIVSMPSRAYTSFLQRRWSSTS